MNARYGKLLVLAGIVASAFVLLGGTELFESHEGRLPKAVAPSGAAAAPAARQATAATSPIKEAGAEALKAAQEALKQDAGNAATWRQMGRVLAERKDYNGAAEAFAAAIEIAPDEARAHNDLGTALLYLGLVRVARAQFEQAIALDGSIPEAHLNLAITLSHAQPADTPRAIAEWQRVVDLVPGTDLARIAQGYIDQYKDGKPQGAAAGGAGAGGAGSASTPVAGRN